MFGFTKRRIYADWAATTPLHPRVAGAMSKVRSFWANPSAIHAEGVAAKAAIESSRVSCAKIISAKPDEVFFTGSGTEANNLILRGVVEASLADGVPLADIHLVSTIIEHPSVLEVLRDIERRGASVTYVGINDKGIVCADEVLAAIHPNTVLVTCMLANNEIGTVQPVSKIGAGIRKVRAAKIGTAGNVFLPVFHSDASQAPLWLACDLEGLRVDALTLDAHKMQGPKGIGLLAVRHGVPCAPITFGGGQERGLRPATESVELVTGFAEALRIAHEGREMRVKRSVAIRDALVAKLEKCFPRIVFNGSFEKRLPNNVNLSLPKLSDPEFAVLKLDHLGIACSTKSSCLKGEESSFVVAALGGPDWRAKNTLRFSLDPNATLSDVNKIVIALKGLW